MIAYYRQVLSAFWQDFRKATSEQVITVLLALAILLFQFRYGLIERGNLGANLQSVTLPYLALVGVLLIVHFVRAHWKVYADADSRYSIAMAEARESENALRGELQSEINKRHRPDVIVTCDWPIRGTSSSIFSQRRLQVRNLSEVPAINVKITDISFGESSYASFDEIPILERSEPRKAECRVVEKVKSTSRAWDLETFIEDSCCPHAIDYGSTEAPPIRVTAQYQDSHGVQWESVNELVYDFFLRKGTMKHVEIRELL